MNQYELELGRLPSSYKAAIAAPVDGLRAAVAAASESSLIGVGSGGSFTVASLICGFHEAYTGRVSRASTPLELISNPTLAAASPVFLVSSEGRNPDIVEALRRARHHSARPIHVLTNRENSPLLECIASLTEIDALVFRLEEKDGYLATNSLLMNSVLVARAYSDLDQAKTPFPSDIEELRLADSTVREWLDRSKAFLRETAPRSLLLVVYSPLVKSVAADIESKLSEAALVHCQLTDLRSFAHGRHLWMSSRRNECSILAIVEPQLSALWAQMRALLPADCPTCTLPLAGSGPRDLVAGLIAQMRFVGALASLKKQDPGRPSVPQFGHDLHYMNLESSIPPQLEVPQGELQEKYEVMGSRWPSRPNQGTLRRALDAYRQALVRRTFRAIVFDYDGTLKSAHLGSGPPTSEIVEQLARLVDSGVQVGIASGRGGSAQDELRSVLGNTMWPKILLGLYNGGCVVELGEDIPKGEESSEYLSHVARIVGRLQAIGVPIERIRTTQPYQVSVRFREGIGTEHMWFVVADGLRQAGLDISRMYRSRRSIDVLAPGVGKSRLIAALIRKAKLEPYSVLTIGDQGAWPGNDSTLLEHRFSVSVDLPSRRVDRGWKLAPAHKRNVDATLWYLGGIETLSNGEFRILLTSESAQV